MARRRRRRSTATVNVSDISAQIYQHIEPMRQLRDQLAVELDKLDAALAALEGASTRRVGRGIGRVAKVAAPIAGRAVRRRGQRGAGWAAIEGVFKKQGGSGKTPDLKDAWAQLGSRTPLSVALASFVRSGRLKRKGKGRDTVFSLA